MRFYASFSKPIKIACLIIAGLSVIGCVFAILAFSGAHIELSTAQAKLLLAVCPISAVIALLLATIHYKITDTHLQLNLAFVDMLGGRINIDNILNIVIKNQQLYISFLWKGMDPIIAHIAIAPTKYKIFTDLLMSKNKNIVFYDEDKNEATDSQ